MRLWRLALVFPLLCTAHAQIGLGISRAHTPQDFDLTGPVKHVLEQYRYAEEEVLPAATLLSFTPWITTTYTFTGNQLTRMQRLGGRTDGVEANVIMEYVFQQGCLRRVRLDDRSLRGKTPPADAERREDTLSVGSRCRPTESLEALFGKPSLRKAYTWTGDAVRVIAYRKDNSVAYTFDSTCFSPAPHCQETTRTDSGRITETTILHRTASGRLIRKEERLDVTGSIPTTYVSTYNPKGWLTGVEFLNEKTGKAQLLRAFKYPKVDGRGNWTAQETYTVSFEFGKQQLGLVGYTTRQITYAK